MPLKLKDDDRFILVENGRYLLIKHTQLEDVGTYVCELTNILGKKQGHINLKIRGEITTALPSYIFFVS